MPAYTLGLNCKLYRNSNTYESPTWEEVKNVRDVTLTLEKGESDATTRENGGWEAVVAALKKGAIEFEMVWKKTDANFQAIRNAYLNDTTIEVLVLDGDKDTNGSEGLRAEMGVFKFSRMEELAEVVKSSVSMKPTYSDHAPTWYTVGA